MFAKRVFVTLSALFILGAVSSPFSAQAVTINFTGFQAVMEISTDFKGDGQTASLFMDPDSAPVGLQVACLNL